MTNTLTLTKTPVFHNKVKGDTDALNEYLVKNNLAKQLKSTPGHYESIPLGDLVPLESQRNAKTAWIKKALKLSGGFDPVAAGIIQVARDPATGINYVWDGAGRLALAQAAGVSHLNCWVIELDPKSAAHYFVYTQKTANRTLSADELFINAYEKGERSAVEFSSTLLTLGMRIQGADDYWVPRVAEQEKFNYPTCAERSVRQALRFAKGDLDIVRFARDTIVQAGWNDDQIRRDLLPGLVIVYMAYPEMMRNGLNKAFRQYFQNLAGTVAQGKLQFKHMGGNLHNHEAESVAIGIIYAFRNSPAMKPSFANVVTKSRIEEYVDKLLTRKNSDDLEDMD